MSKRKSEMSPDKMPEKVRKVLSTIGGVQNVAQTGDTNVQKMIEKWVTGSQTHVLLSQEVQENIRLKEIEQKCSEAESKVQFLEDKLRLAEETNCSLLATVKVEAKMKDEIGEKMKTTCELVSTISEHFEFITETYKRFQQHTDYLSKLYDTVILNQKETINNITQQLNNVTLRLNTDSEHVDIAAKEKDNTKRLLEQQERELFDLRVKHHSLENQISQKDKLIIEAANKLQVIEKRQLELEAEKLAIQKIAEDYENKISIEKNQIINSFKEEKDELIKSQLKYETEATKFKEEYDKLMLSFQDIKIEKEKCIETLIEKELLLSEVEKSVNTYKIQIQEFINVNEELSFKMEQLVHERNEQKEQLKLQLQLKNDENLKIRTDLEDITRRNNELSESMNTLEQRIIKQKEEQEKLLTNLMEAKNNLVQSEYKYNELVENLKESKNKEGKLFKDKEKWNKKISELNKNIMLLEQEKEKIKSESETKIQDTIHLYMQLQEKLNGELLVQEQKYNECLVNIKNVEAKHSCELQKLESELATTKDQNKMLTEKYFSAKERNEELQNKFKKSAEAQVKNSTSESQLRRRYEKRQVELMATVKEFEEKEVEYLNKIKELEKQQYKVTELMETVKKLEKKEVEYLKKIKELEKQQYKSTELTETVKKLEKKEMEYLNKIKELEKQQDNGQYKLTEQLNVQDTDTEIMPLISVPNLALKAKCTLFLDKNSSSDTSITDIDTLFERTDERFEELLKIQDTESNSLQLISDLPEKKQAAKVAPEKSAPVTKKYFKHNIRTRQSLFKK